MASDTSVGPPSLSGDAEPRDGSSWVPPGPLGPEGPTEATLRQRLERMVAATAQTGTVIRLPVHHEKAAKWESVRPAGRGKARWGDAATAWKFQRWLLDVVIGLLRRLSGVEARRSRYESFFMEDYLKARQDLDPLRRIIFELRIAGMSFRDIAELLDISRSRASNLYTSALRHTHFSRKDAEPHDELRARSGPGQDFPAPRGPRTSDPQ